MPLSEQEQRLLEEMERSLYHNDADFVSAVGAARADRTTAPRARRPRRARRASASSSPASSSASRSSVCWGSSSCSPVCSLAVTPQPGSTRRRAAGVPVHSTAHPARPPQVGLMDRLNDRWDRRQDGDEREPSLLPLLGVGLRVGPFFVRLALRLQGRLGSVPFSCRDLLPGRVIPPFLLHPRSPDLRGFCIDRRVECGANCIAMVVGSGVKWRQCHRCWPERVGDGCDVPRYLRAQARRKRAHHPAGEVPRRTRLRRRHDPWPGALRLRLQPRASSKTCTRRSARRRSPASRPATTCACSSPARATRPPTSSTASPSRATLREYAGLEPRPHRHRRRQPRRDLGRRGMEHLLRGPGGRRSPRPTEEVIPGSSDVRRP